MITSSKLRKIKIIQARDERHSATKFSMQLRTEGRMGGELELGGRKEEERGGKAREREQAREIKEMVCRKLVN